MKHTPGTWAYWPEGNAVVVHQNHRLRAVADFGKVDLIEREANAQLIAAAPELLAALRDVLEDVATSPAHVLSLPLVTIRKVQAALKKAEGR